MPREYKQPGKWMLDGLMVRDQWQSAPTSDIQMVSALLDARSNFRGGKGKPEEMKDATAIVGIAENRVRKKKLDPSEKDLACQAIFAALADAGILPIRSGRPGFLPRWRDDEAKSRSPKNIGAGDITFFSQVGYGGGRCGTRRRRATGNGSGHGSMSRGRKRGDRASADPVGRIWADTKISVFYSGGLDPTMGPASSRG